MGQVRSSLGRAQQRVDHLAPPLVAIVTMAGALAGRLRAGTAGRHGRGCRRPRFQRPGPAHRRSTAPVPDAPLWW
ncbi:hypothetical protein G6F60_015714 [Rhizopus arrhizus]|nr:hypothetical protein G6F40_016811 [Rhizopus arrhizus]KAG1244815.1 hypothetical protein G6F66_015645 [Rhizopus arrhizus]KAG1368879.1 hypothetical protein G6F60_015714 [Rhizopus arrhizus]